MNPSLFFFPSRLYMSLLSFPFPRSSLSITHPLPKNLDLQHQRETFVCLIRSGFFIILFLYSTLNLCYFFFFAFGYPKKKRQLFATTTSRNDHLMILLSLCPNFFFFFKKKNPSLALKKNPSVIPSLVHQTNPHSHSHPPQYRFANHFLCLFKPSVYMCEVACMPFWFLNC
jgi:hypothetical protein